MPDMPGHDIHDPAMGHGEDALPGMPSCNLVQGRDDPIGELIRQLPFVETTRRIPADDVCM